ncbi:MAG: TonB-dependent receptor, partial [Gemmatimonadetes bacterium]|nr:TonB-dependent receptor [Gemmatimonadota bacterium]
IDCQLPNTPLTIRGKLSYRDGFPMQSGVYVGDVDAYTVLDLSTSYQLPLSHDRFKITWNVEASNVLNQEYRSFIGAPFIGRLVLTGLNIRF